MKDCTRPFSTNQLCYRVLHISLDATFTALFKSYFTNLAGIASFSLFNTRIGEWLQAWSTPIVSSLIPKWTPTPRCSDHARKVNMVLNIQRNHKALHANTHSLNTVPSSIAHNPYLLHQHQRPPPCSALVLISGFQPLSVSVVTV